MIIKKEEKNGITIYHVSKDLTDEKCKSLLDSSVKPSQIHTILNDNADVYTEDGKLLLVFRKNKLNKENIKEFYDNTIKFVSRKVSSKRGNASGSKIKKIGVNPKTMAHIIGYFDNLGVKQRYVAKQKGIKISLGVRETLFNMDFPEKFKKTIPLIKEIDKLYEKYAPKHYEQQRKKANQTPFIISDTAFSTVTININFKTGIHTDKGDDPNGFGNLAVIEHGEYTGGETCFPQYGIGVNVRTGDILLMDVHQIHGNLPITYKTPDAKRMAIVCYLREQIWKKTKGKTKKFAKQHLEKLNKIRTTKPKLKKSITKKNTK
jgi:hypothetical protein